MKSLIISILLLLHVCCFAQNKAGNTWICGGYMGQITFKGDTTRPVHKFRFGVNHPNAGLFYFGRSHTNICDSATGQLLFVGNGARLFDTLGNLLPNSDSLWDPICGDDLNGLDWNQGSLILPQRGSRYYVFQTNFTDAAAIANNIAGALAGTIQMMYASELRYSIVDMQQNGGLGAVVSKNNMATTTGRFRTSGMHALRHANGRDWWLMKQGWGPNYSDSNYLFRFLVTPDTVLGPWEQYVSNDTFQLYHTAGHISFSQDGSKITYALGNGGYFADFDRCTGLVSNGRKIPRYSDSTWSYPGDTVIHTDTGYYDPVDTFLYFSAGDDATSATCFSPNNRFLYVTHFNHIYQYDTWNTSADMGRYTLLSRESAPGEPGNTFGNLQLGHDGRIYVGHRGKSIGGWQVIHNPNGFRDSCNLQIRGMGPTDSIWVAGLQIHYKEITDIPNIPNYNLGALPGWELCPPLALRDIVQLNKALIISPNPCRTGGSITLHYSESYVGQKSTAYALYDLHGQVLHRGTIFANMPQQVFLPPLASGMYLLRCGGLSQRLHVE